MNSLLDHIIVLENVLSDEQCARIVAEYEGDQWMPGMVYDGNENTRKVDTISISEERSFAINAPARKLIDAELFVAAEKALIAYGEKFPLFFSAGVTKDTGYELLRYGEGQYVDWHVDARKELPRLLTASFLLNDGFEGGGWEFFPDAHKVHAPKGSAVIFPPTYMFPHRVTPITKGTRYSIVTWFM